MRRGYWWGRGGLLVGIAAVAIALVLLYLFGLLPISEETSFVTKFDDGQTGFWTVAPSGSGGISASLSDDTSTRIRGADSLRITVTSGSSSNVKIYHDYSPAEDWSSKDFFHVWWYGGNTGKSIVIWVDHAQDETSGSMFRFADDFAGWRRTTFALRDADEVVGTQDWSSVEKIRLYIESASLGDQYYLDEGGIDVGQPLYDDDEAFWTAYQSGSGSIGLTLTEETSIVRKGSSSLKMVLGAGSYANVGAQHNYGSAQDWSGYDFIAIWFYGANTGNQWRVEIDDGPSNNRKWYFNDDYTGWKRFVFPLRNPDVDYGSIDLSAIVNIFVITESPATGTTYLDRTLVYAGH